MHDCGVTLLLQASYGVEDAEFAVTQLAQTTMRSELGMHNIAPCVVDG